MSRRDLFTFSYVAELCVQDNNSFLTMKDFIRSKTCKEKNEKGLITLYHGWGTKPILL